MAYDGNLGMNDVQNYLENNDAKFQPTTEQDTLPHKDGLFGREYNEQFDPTKVGQPAEGGRNDVLNAGHLGTGLEADHVDVIEQDPLTESFFLSSVDYSVV
jgi:hypothetical protein